MAEISHRDRLVRAAENQTLFREVNERLQDLAQSFRWIAESGTYTCECADTTCAGQMSLTVDEYEAVRSKPNQFAVLPGHVYPDVERPVYEVPRFVVVAMLGVGAEVAEASDPRSQQG